MASAKIERLKMLV